VNEKHTLIAVVVLVCSPSTVTTAKGSGNLKTSRFANESAATTVEVNIEQEEEDSYWSASDSSQPNLISFGRWWWNSKTDQVESSTWM